MSTPPLPHPTLHCALVGKPADLTIQYRNLQYATIPARWQESVLLDTVRPNAIVDGKPVYDARTLGPSCPQKCGAQAWDLTLVGSDLVLNMEGGQGGGERMDEWACLNVNVTVPKSLVGREGVQNERGLPVLVWVHGGGLSIGSNSWPQYDLARFVERSVRIGKPVIGVAVNYRVGVLGFLKAGELGVEGNLGFKDLILAFQWVRRHVGGFGGDARNVTAAGESAGGIALSTILCSEVALGEGCEALFDRVVVMSGDVTLRNPRGRRWHEEMYDEQLKFLGLEEVGTEERVKKLREWDAVELCQKLPLAQYFCGYVDGKWLKEKVTLGTLEDGSSEVHKPAWCKEFVVGDTAHDGTIFKARVLDDPHALARLHALCIAQLTPSESSTLLTAYNLSLPPTNTPDPLTSDPLTTEQAHALLLLVSELRFYLPSLLMHQGWTSRFDSSTSQDENRVSRYHFHFSNPFPGSFLSLASHELDVGFLLQNLNHLLPDESREEARGMADHFIGFVNGDGWCKGGEVVVFTNGGVKVVGEGEYEKVFREGRGEVLGKIGGAKLWKLAEEWQGVRAEVDEVEVERKASELR